MACKNLSTNAKAKGLARGLGWFSIALGLAEILAPRRVARLVGVPERVGLIRLIGLREIASGLAIFTQSRPAGALWSRVGGDVMGLGLLGASYSSEYSNRARLATATAAVAGVTALDVFCSEQLSRHQKASRPGAPGAPPGDLTTLSELKMRTAPGLAAAI